ncbi:MAG: energy transducer TonB [Bacteroidota bacterium]
MLARIKNKRHAKILLAVLTTTLIIGLVLLNYTKSKATNIYFVEKDFEEQTDSLKVLQKADSTYDDKTFIKVEVPAEFPGGLDGWRRYLERNLNYPKKAAKNKTQGTVKVQVVVESNGTLSEVAALNDPGDGLAQEAERIIRKGPNWKPAEQNGRKVKHRFVQTITFQLQ